MSPSLKRIISIGYGFALITVCLLLAVLSGAYAWSGRTRGKSGVAAFAVAALFFIYVAAVLVFQAVRSRQYKRVIASLGFVPLDWKLVPFNETLRVVFPNRRKAFCSGLVHGDSCGTHIYLFNCARGLAWWSRKKTTVVFERPGVLNPDDGVARRLAEKGDAELVFHQRWCVIQARHEIRPTALPEWLETVVGITTGS